MGFTLPRQLAPVVLQNKKVVYDLCFVPARKLFSKSLAIPDTSVRNWSSACCTSNQKVRLHPHIHCVVPAGGLSLDHTRWVHSPDNYFLPKAVLRKVFRGKFVAGLRQAFQNRDRLPRKVEAALRTKIFAGFLRPLFRQHWVVYLKRPFGGPEYVLQYSVATPIAWPSPIIAWSHLSMAK